MQCPNGPQEHLALHAHLARLGFVSVSRSGCKRVVQLYATAGLACNVVSLPVPLLHHRQAQTRVYEVGSSSSNSSKKKRKKKR